MDDEPYDVLGVGRDASKDEIRDAYRRLVKEYHPDVSDAPDAEERFVRIREAYEAAVERAPEQARQGGAADGERRDGSERSGGGSGFDTATREDGDTEERGQRYVGRRRRSDDDLGERVEGLRGGWVILRDTTHDGVDWYVYRRRSDDYIDGSGGRSRTPHSFGSRDEARKAHSKLRGRRKQKRREREARRRVGEFEVVEEMDGKWRLGRGKDGYVIVSHGPPYTFLNNDGDVQVDAEWFETADEARAARRRRVDRAATVEVDERLRLALAPLALPFIFALRKLSSAENDAPDRTNTENYLAVAGMAGGAIGLAVAFDSLVLGSIGVIAVVLLFVILLSPYDV